MSDGLMLVLQKSDTTCKITVLSKIPVLQVMMKPVAAQHGARKAKAFNSQHALRTLAGTQQTESNFPRPTGIYANSSNGPSMMSTTTGFVEFKCPPHEKGQDLLHTCEGSCGRQSAWDDAVLPKET